jgi:hypothetical protein
MRTLQARFDANVDRFSEHHLWHGSTNPTRGTGQLRADAPHRWAKVVSLRSRQGCRRRRAAPRRCRCRSRRGDGLWEFPRPGFELRIRPDTVEELVLQPPCARAPRHRGRKPCMRGWGPEHLTEDPSRPRSRRRGSFWDCCSRPSRPHLKPTLLWPNRQPPADIRRQTSEAHSLVLRVPMTTSATRMVTMRTANTMISGTPMPSIGAYLPSAARRLHGRVTGSPNSYPPDLSSLCLDWVCETGGVARQQLDRSRRRVMPRS